MKRVFVPVMAGAFLCLSVLALACDLQAEFADLTAQMGGSGSVSNDDNWMRLYTRQFNEIMKAASEGDEETACDEIEDLKDWLDRNPRQ